MDNDNPEPKEERKDIRIPPPPTTPPQATQAVSSSPMEFGKDSLPSFNAVAIRILRRSWIEALQEMQNEQIEKVYHRELEFRDFLILFLKRSWIIAILAGAGYWYGHYQAAKLPDKYSSTALLVPTAPVGAAESGDDGSSVSPDLSLFSALMKSRTVMLQVLKSPVYPSPEDSVPVPYAATLGIDTADVIDMQNMANSLGSSIYMWDEGSGIFRLSFTSTDAFVVPQMADIILAATQKELVRVKTQRMSSALAVLQKRLQEAEQEYRQASSRMAGFLSRNVEMESGDLQVRQSQLQSDLDMKEQAYIQARARTDAARAELDQAYPPAMVFDPASRPAQWVGPDRGNKAMLAGFIGLVLGVVVVLGWEFLLKKRRED